MRKQDSEEGPESSLELEMAGLHIKPGDRIGAYVYERPIGEGGMAHVVLARDPNHREVALKILKASRFKTGLPRFRREFRALSRIHHPNVIRVESYGDLYSHPFIAMEYVEGLDLHQTIRNFVEMENFDERWRRCEELLIDICRALDHVHQRGLVHRDLKPSNILINPEGRAKLTDFGIVKDLDPKQDAHRTGTLVGTWAYTSPEQIAGRPLDHRSDLYSLGVILFAMLTSRRPFAAKDMAGYRKAHLEIEPPRARDIIPLIPEHLDTICHRLLQKSPQDRFQSAREILYQLEQLEEHPSPGLEHWRPPLVGRDRELETLFDAVAALTRGEGCFVSIEGPEGTGCSRMLEAISERATAIGLPFHRLKTTKGTGMESLLTLSKEIHLELGSRSPARLSSALAEWHLQSAQLGDLAWRLLDGLVDALKLILDDGPRLLLFDDFHMASPREVELMSNLIRVLLGEERPLFLAWSIKTEALSPELNRLLNSDRLGVVPLRMQLSPLSARAILQMIESLIGSGEKAKVLARRLHKETEGNALFVSQFLASLIQHGILVPGLKGRMQLTVDAEELATGHLEFPPGIRQLAETRIQTLSPGELRIMQALAVSGRELEFELLLEVLDEEEDQVLDRIDLMLTSGVVRERRHGDFLYHEVSHRILSDYVYRKLDPDHRSLLHRRLARALEDRFATNPTAIELVGDHYRHAGEAGKAYRYLVAAAARMYSRSLPTEAWEISGRAAAIEDLARVDLDKPDLDDSRIRLLRTRASLLYGHGEWVQCHQTLDALRKVTIESGNAWATVRARIELGRVLMRMEEIDAGQQWLDKALRQARKLKDREGVVEALCAMAGTAWEMADLDRCARLSEEGLVLAVGDAMLRLRAELLIASTAVQAFRGQFAHAAAGMEEAESIFRDLGQKSHRCITLCNLGELLIWQGELPGARLRIEEAYRLSKELDYRLGYLSAIRLRGEIYMEVGRYERAGRQLKRALEVAVDLSLNQDIIALRYTLAVLHATLDEPQEAEGHISVARALANKRDPEQFAPALMALQGWACAKTGDSADARRMFQMAESTLAQLPAQRACQVLLTCARGLEAMGERDEAERMATMAAGTAASRGLRLRNLEARLLLSEITEDAEAATAWQTEARGLVRAFLEELDARSAEAFRHRFKELV